MEASIRYEIFNARHNGKPIATQVVDEIQDENIDTKEQRRIDREYRRLKRDCGVNALHIEINDLKRERDRYRNMIMDNPESLAFKLDKKEKDLKKREEKIIEKERELKNREQERPKEETYQSDYKPGLFRDKYLEVKAQIDLIYQNNASPEFVRNLMEKNEYKILLNRNRQLMIELQFAEKQRNECLNSLHELRLKYIIPTGMNAAVERFEKDDKA